jgi:RNA polymerase sigma-70 factor (ECF subfamily)
MSRDGTIVTIVTIDASADGIDQILWMMRPSKLTAISKSQQTTINRGFRTA